MSFLLDTNVISEWVKPRPDAGVVRWLAEVDEDRVFLSVVSLAELGYGIERLPRGRRRTRLSAWLQDDVAERFNGRLLPVDPAVADGWGRVVAARDALGRPIGIMDAFVAATAIVHGLQLVTRNETDFTDTVNEIVNPWSE